MIRCRIDSYLMHKKILIIEDETDIVNLLTHYLGKEGYVVHCANDGISGLQLIRREKLDLIILDLMLPELDGLEVCKKLRSSTETAHLPILIVTAKGEELDKIVGLELGADDYMTKPFSPKELVARVKALLRRSEQQYRKPASYIYGHLVLDLASHEVRVNGETINLRAKEFGLLSQLLKNKGRLMTRDALLDTVWGYDSDVSTRTIDVHIRRLREKIPLLSEAIATVKSYGYKLKNEGE